MKKLGIPLYTLLFSLCILFTFQNLLRIKSEYQTNSNTSVLTEKTLNGLKDISIDNKIEDINSIKAEENIARVKAANCVNPIWDTDDHFYVDLGSITSTDFATEIPSSPTGHRNDRDCFEYSLAPRVEDDGTNDPPYFQRSMHLYLTEQYVGSLRYQVHDYNDTVGYGIAVLNSNNVWETLLIDDDAESDSCGITGYNPSRPWRNGCYVTRTLQVNRTIKAIYISANADRNEGIAFRILNVNTDLPPIGNHDAANCSATWGWTCDPTSFADTVEVDIYADGPMGSGTLVASGIQANQTRNDVTGMCGGQAAHGFSWNIPDSLKNGQSRNLYVYAKNRGPGSRPPVLLSNSPKSISCTPSNTPPQCNGFNTYSGTSTTNPLATTAAKRLTDTITVRVASSDAQGLRYTGICWTANSLTQAEYRTGSNFTCTNVCNSSSTLGSCTYNNNNQEHRGYVTDTIQHFIDTLPNQDMRNKATQNGLVFLSNLTESSIGGGLCSTNPGYTEQGVYLVGSNFNYNTSCGVASSGNCTRRITIDTGATPINGTCGTNARTYSSSETAYSGNFCATGTPNPTNPSFPTPSSYTLWTCNGLNGGSSTTCTASRSANLGGVCGTAATAYPANATAFSGSLCTVGMPSPVIPTFPAQGGSSAWTCVGFAGAGNASCAATRALPVNGACGIAATNYEYNATGYIGDFCSSGTSNPPTPAFPDQAETVTWSCVGSPGGTNATCTATRNLESCQNNPNNVACNQCLNPGQSPISQESNNCSVRIQPRIKMTDNNSLGDGAKGIDANAPLKFDWTNSLPYNNPSCMLTYALEVKRTVDPNWITVVSNRVESEVTVNSGVFSFGTEYQWRVRSTGPGNTVVDSPIYTFTTNFKPEYLQSGAGYVARDASETPHLDMQQAVGTGNPTQGLNNRNSCNGNQGCNIGPVNGANKFGGADTCFTGSYNMPATSTFGQADNPIIFWFDYEDKDNYTNTTCAGNEFSKHKLALVPKGSYNVDTVDDNLDVVNRANLFVEYDLKTNQITNQKGEVIITPMVRFDGQNKLRMAYKLKFRDEFASGSYDIFALVNSEVNDPRQGVGGTLLYDTHILPSTGQYRKVGEWTVDTTAPDVQEPIYSNLGIDTFNVGWNIRTDSKLLDVNLGCYSADQSILDKSKASVLGTYNPNNFVAGHIYPFPGDFAENGSNKCSSDSAVTDYKNRINSALNSIVNMRTRHKIDEAQSITAFRAKTGAIDYACNSAVSPAATTDLPNASPWIHTYGGTVMSQTINTQPQTTLDSTDHNLYCNYEGQTSANNDTLYSKVNSSTLFLSTSSVISTDSTISNVLETSLVGAQVADYIDSLDANLNATGSQYYDLIRKKLDQLTLISNTINGDRTISKVSELGTCAGESCYIEIIGDLTINGNDGVNASAPACDGKTMVLVNGNLRINNNLIKSAAEMCCAFIVRGSINFGKPNPNDLPKDELRYNNASAAEKASWINTSQYDCTTGFYFSENGNITIEEDTSNYGITSSGENFSDAFALQGYLIAQKGDIIQNRSNGLRNNLQPPVYIKQDSCIYKNFKVASEAFLSTRDLNY